MPMFDTDGSVLTRGDAVLTHMLVRTRIMCVLLLRARIYRRMKGCRRRLCFWCGWTWCTKWCGSFRTVRGARVDKFVVVSLVWVCICSNDETISDVFSLCRPPMQSSSSVRSCSSCWRMPRTLRASSETSCSTYVMTDANEHTNKSRSSTLLFWR